MCWAYFDIFWGEDFVGGFDKHLQLDNQSKKQCLAYNYEHAMKGELFPLDKVFN